MSASSRQPSDHTGSEASGPTGPPRGEKARAKGRVGQIINGKWRLDALLGVGGMATVYAATHRNGSRAALKILHPELSRDAGVRDRFLREGYVANKSDHRGRVAVLDDDITENGEPFLVMELLEGANIQQVWKKRGRRLPVLEALSIAEQVLDTLASYHVQGVIHRDLKPANIFLTRDKVVKVLDFGVARMRDAGGDKTRAGTALGTPSFMAPEQAMGVTEGLDARADVFSVGATLYALLSGQRLHQGRSDNEAFILAATQPAGSLARVAPDLPVEVIALVDKALQWDPRNRFDGAEGMRREVLRVIDLLGGSAPRPDAAPEVEAEDDAVEAAPEPHPEDDGRVAEEDDAEPDDPVVQKLVEAFKRVERALAAARQYGAGHPEADNKLRQAHHAFADALRAHPQAVMWTVSPYGFAHRGQSVWEPGAPLDVVPYGLFASGVRGVRMSQGLREDEVRVLCEVMLLDPTRDLAPEDDVAAALWERKLDHVAYDIVNVYAEGDADDAEAFYEEAERLEQEAMRFADLRHAEKQEAAAMSVETDQGAIKAARQAASVLGLDLVAKKALGAQMTMTPERWMERYVDALADALANTRRHGDTPLVLGPIAAYVGELVQDGRMDQAVALHDALLRALSLVLHPNEQRELRMVVTEGMFAPETVRTLLQAAAPPPPGQPPAAALLDPDAVARWLLPVFAELGPSHFDVSIEALPTVQHEGLRNLLLSYVERSLAGREAQAADKAMTFELDVARPVMRMLANLGTPAAVQALRRLAGMNKASLACEAIALLTPNHEQLKDELAQLAASPDPEVRSAAIRTLAYHQVRPAGPLLVYRIQDDSFQQLPFAERREILDALYMLHPSRAEALACEILERHGIFADDSLEQTRILCAELLGRVAKSDEALEATINATKRRWWNSQGLRDVATAAAQAIAARAGKSIAPPGSAP